MFHGKGLTIPLMSNEHIIIEASFDRIIGRVSVLTLEEHMGDAGLGTDEIRQ